MTVTSPNASMTVEVTGAIAFVAFNRPETLNALDEDLAYALGQITGAISEDNSIRCVVLSGAGDHFMAGGDVKGFKALLDENPDEAAIRAHFDEMLTIVHGFIADFRQMPKPVLGSVQGAVAGAGFSLMLACDMVLAADDSFYTLAYCHLGTAPDAGSTFALPRTVGLKKASEIALLGDRFDAAEAFRCGLVNRLVPASELQAETDKLAKRLAEGPVRAYAETKALLNGSLTRSLEEQLAAETAAFANCTVTEDFKEGVTAFVEKRPPRFTGS